MQIASKLRAAFRKALNDVPQYFRPRIEGSRPGYLMHVAVLAALCFVAGKLGLLLAISPGNATAIWTASPIWPASGIALAAILLFGYRLWPGIFLGSLLVNIGTSFDASSALLLLTSLALATSLSIGAALQAVVGAMLVRRFVGFPNALVHSRDVLKFLVLGGPISCMTSATLGVSSLFVAGVVPAGEAAFGCWTWWIGDTIGVLIVTPLILIWTAEPRRIWRRRRLSVALPLGLTFAVAVVAFIYASKLEQDRIGLEFKKQSATVARVLENSFDGYIEVVRSIGRFYASSQEVDRREFSTFVMPAFSHHSGIQALEWIPRVSDLRRPAYEENASADGYPQFRITERDKQGRLVPASNRAEYFPVYYVEPYKANESALGFDVASDPSRLTALERARDTGELTATTRVTLVQELGHQYGVLVILPIYSNGSPHDTLEQRRQNLQGYALGVFRIGDVVAASLKSYEQTDIKVRLYDATAPEAQRVLHGEDLTPPGSKGVASGQQEENLLGMHWATPLEMADHQWELRLSPTLDYLAEQRTWSAWAVLAAGLLFTSLTSAFLLVITGKNANLGTAVNSLKREITHREQVERALFYEKERVQVTLESIGDAVITTDVQGRVNYCNAVAEALTGWCRAEAYGQPLSSVFNIVNEETRERVADPVARCLTEGTVVGLANHTVLLNRQEYEYAIQDSAAPIRNGQGTVLGAVLVFSDVSEQRRLSREISHQASHDELTGLVNRREFEHRLERVLETAHADHNEHALCYVDLDQFKVVNDTCGHTADDALLGQIADLFRGQIRERDTLARLGGDEFGVLLEHCGLEQAQRVANALRSAVDEYRFVWEDKPFRIGASIGVVRITEDSRSIAALLQAADSACYAAKDAGRNRIHVYHKHDAQLARRHGEMQWVSRIQQALEDDGFRLYTQRIEHIEPNAATGLHCEVLLRLVDETGRITLPGVFIPAAERYDLAVRIDRWVIDHVLRWLAEHPTVVDSLELCTINLSGHSLSDRLFESHILRQLEVTGIQGEKIGFEITETAAIANLNDATRFIKTLKTHGCRFALDDFGSGLSSFAYLKNLPVDFLKIDGIFVKDMVDDPIDLAMVRSINEIGQLMGKQTIAEYVENEAIRNHLCKLGVNFVQGFGVSRPQPIAHLLKETGRYSLVEERSHTPVV